MAYLASFTAYFMIANPLSGAVGTPISSLILAMDSLAGLHGWQWMFLLEGLPAFLLAFAVLKFLPDGPLHASWLTKEEKDTVPTRLATEIPAGRPDLWSTLRDPRVLALGLAYFTWNCAGIGITLWLPQIVKAMGFSITAAGFVVALCYVACVPAMIFGGLSSSRRRERIWHVSLPHLFIASCLAIASITQSNAIVLAMLVVGLPAAYATFGPFFSLPASFLRGAAAAGAIGLVGTIGNVGAFSGASPHWRAGAG